MVLADRFGVDALRYFLLREVSFGQDGSYSAEAIVNRANAELANSFGNLAQRTLSMIHKNLDGILPVPGETLEDKGLLDLVRKATNEELPEAFERLAFSVGIEAWLKAVFACNAYVDTQAPWTLRKTDPDRMAAITCGKSLKPRNAPRIPTRAPWPVSRLRFRPSSVPPSFSGVPRVRGSTGRMHQVRGRRLTRNWPSLRRKPSISPCSRNWVIFYLLS